MSDAVKQLIQAGILGPVLVIAIYYIWHLSRQLNIVQEKRVQELRELVDATMRMGDRWVAALNANTRALEAQARQMDEVKQALETLK